MMKDLIAKIHKLPRPLLLSAFIVSLILSLVALRHNNEHMVYLRNQLYTADKNDTNVNQALNNLRAYVYGHMNTDLSAGNSGIKPPIQLKYTYQRLVQSQLGGANSQNTQLYTDAENYCQKTVPNGFYGAYRIPCVEQYLSTHGLQSAPPPPNPALYEFDFASPSWSPDMAGLSLAVTAILFLLYIASLTHHYIYRGQKPKRPTR